MPTARDTEIMYCRGEITRRQLVKGYDIKPVAFVQLLPGQKKSSCTGDALTDAYYCFSYSSKHKLETGTLLCGTHAARHFLSLIGHPPLPLFNPLKSAIATGGSAIGGSGNPNTWNSTARQLHNAICLLIVCWNSPPGFVLAKIKDQIERAHMHPPTDAQIKAINTIVGADSQRRTLSSMIGVLSVEHSIKSYSFNEIDARLIQIGITSNFT